MIEWKTTPGLTPLKTAIKTMEKRVLDIHHGKKNQLIWFLEHPHVYTGGTSADESHILGQPTIPVEMTRRGGSYTYHGPGQRVVYIMLDLKKQEKDIRKFVWNLEQWIIESLAEFSVSTERRETRIGVWVVNSKSGHSDSLQTKELKIASIGLRVKKWISYFGISINVHPNLNYFNGIVPCGNSGFGITSMHNEGLTTTLTELDSVLKHKFGKNFINTL